jgi:uncharacterized membrane protein
MRCGLTRVHLTPSSSTCSIARKTVFARASTVRTTALSPSGRADRVNFVSQRLRSVPRATAGSDGVEDDNNDDNATPWVQPGYLGAVVSGLDESAQTAVVLGVWAGILLATYECCTVVGPALESLSPGLMAWSKTTWPVIGVTYVAAGVAHFTVHDGFVSMMPHQGAWGFWRLPGSPSFHVNWTGVAEIAGGLGLVLGSLPFGLTPDSLAWLSPASAAALFLLTVVVTPANTYMFTHNSPGPLPPNADESMRTIPTLGHLARGGLQVFLLSLLHGVAVR